MPKLKPADPRALMQPKDKIEATKMLQWLQDDVTSAVTLGAYAMLERCAETRDCWRATKYHADGRESLRDSQGRPRFGVRSSFPYPGAIQSESRMVDERCNDEANEFQAAWFLAKKRFAPSGIMDEQERVRKSLACQKTGEYFLNITSMEITEAMALAGSCLAEFGSVVFYEGWETQWKRGRKVFRLEEMQQLLTEIALAEAGLAADEGVQMGQEMAVQAVVEGVSVAIQQMIMDESLFDELVVHIQVTDANMPEAEAKRIAKEVQKGEQQVEYLSPMPDFDKPIHEALVPLVDVIYPMAVSSFRKMPRYTRVPWYTEADLIAKSVQEDWDPEFTQDVLNNPGTCVTITANGVVNYPWSLNGFDMGVQTMQPEAMRTSGMYQIAETWMMGVDQMGLQTPYRIIFSSSSEKIGLVEADPLGTGRLPFIGARRTHLRKMVGLTRGVADEIYTHQLVEEMGMDGLVSQGNMRNSPPVLTTTEGGSDGLMPGATIAVTNRYTSGAGYPRYMEVPDISQGSLEVLRLNRERKDSYYKSGEAAAKDPAAARNRTQATLGAYNIIFKEIMEMMFLNIQNKVDGVNIGTINGVPIDLRVSKDDIGGALDITVKCSIEQMDLEFAVEKMKAFIEFVAVADKNGQFDWSKIATIFADYIDVELAQTAMMSLDEATDKARKDENLRITQIMALVPLEYPDGQRPDAVPVRQQTLQIWLQNPEVLRKMAENPQIKAAIEKEQQWLWFDQQQYQVNATTGRTGVSPESVVAETAPEPV